MSAATPAAAAGWLEKSIYLIGPRYDGVLPPCEAALDTIAYRFAQKEGRLSAYVGERTNSLFIRPKMWAALTYLREVEPASYASELLAIWQLPQLRPSVQTRTERERDCAS